MESRFMFLPSFLLPANHLFHSFHFFFFCLQSEHLPHSLPVLHKAEMRQIAAVVEYVELFEHFGSWKDIGLNERLIKTRSHSVFGNPFRANDKP